MRARIVTLLTVTALGGLLTACGGGGKITIGDAADGPPPTVAPDAGGGGGGGGGGETTGTIPDFGSVDDECLQASTAFAAMTAGLTGQDLPPEAQEQIEAARDSLPDDIRDDYDVFVEAFRKLETDGLIAAGEALASEEIQTAGDNISKYIDEVCGTGGG